MRWPVVSFEWYGSACWMCLQCANRAAGLASAMQWPVPTFTPIDTAEAREAANEQMIEMLGEMIRRAASRESEPFLPEGPF